MTIHLLVFISACRSVDLQETSLTTTHPSPFQLLYVVQCIKSNRNLSFGHFQGLWTGFGPGLDHWVDMARAEDEGHINLVVQALSINLDSARSLGYYCLNGNYS